MPGLPGKQLDEKPKQMSLPGVGPISALPEIPLTKKDAMKKKDNINPGRTMKTMKNIMGFEKPKDSNPSTSAASKTASLLKASTFQKPEVV